MKFVVLVILFTLSACKILATDRFKRRAGEWSLKGVTCYSNPKLVKNGMCKLKAVKRDLTMLSFGFTLLEAQHKVFMVVRIWQKTSSNRYMPGFLNVKEDFCKMMSTMDINGTSNILKTVLEKIEPEFKEKYKAVPHPCPYSGEIYLYNASFPTMKGNPFISMIPEADFKKDFSFLNGANEILYTLTVFSTTK